MKFLKSITILKAFCKFGLGERNQKGETNNVKYPISEQTRTNL